MRQLIRADGAVQRVGTFGGEGKTFFPPSGTKYIDCTVNMWNGYFLRSDGVVVQEKMGGISGTIEPPTGTKYTSIEANQYCSYFLRSDGKIDRTTGYCEIQTAGITATSEPISSSAGWFGN